MSLRVQEDPVVRLHHLQSLKVDKTATQQCSGSTQILKGYFSSGIIFHIQLQSTLSYSPRMQGLSTPMLPNAIFFVICKKKKMLHYKLWFFGRYFFYVRSKRYLRYKTIEL